MPVVSEFRLDNKETSPQYDPIPTYGVSLRRSCQREWSAARQVYEFLDSGRGQSKVERLQWCRTAAWFFRHKETGEVRVGSNACHLRWCPVCSQARRNYIAHVVAEWVGVSCYPKFLTLTLKHTNAPLEWQIQNLYNYFRKLRSRKEFRRCVTGGVWFFQIKKSKNDGLWHPHLHCLITGLYLSKHKLHRMWSQVTFGSFVADIRRVDDPQKAANDAARYASCPGTLVGLSRADGCELVEAMHGRRICGTWGTGRAVSLRPAKEEGKSQWQNIGSWDDVMNSSTDNTNARAIINAWRDKQPLTEGIDCCPVYEIDEKPDKNQEKQLSFDEVYKIERIPP